jgi:hypothetical protein
VGSDLPSFVIVSNNNGEPIPVAGSGLTFGLLQASTNPTVLINEIGVTMNPYGLFTMPDGVYRIEGSVTSCNISSSVTVAVSAFIEAYDAGFTMSSATYGDLVTVGNSKDLNTQVSQWIGPAVWPTLFNGNRLYFGSNAAFSSGTMFNWAYLKITQMSTYNLQQLYDKVLYGGKLVIGSVRSNTLEGKEHSKCRTGLGEFVSPSITISDEEYISVSPQMAAISITSAKRDMLLSSGDFSD